MDFSEIKPAVNRCIDPLVFYLVPLQEFGKCQRSHMVPS